MPVGFSWPLLLPALIKVHCCTMGLRETHEAEKRLEYLHMQRFVDWSQSKT